MATMDVHVHSYIRICITQLTQINSSAIKCHKTLDANRF